MESKNLAFYSTNVVEGKGRGVVVKTGDDTVMGSFAGLVATLDSGQTPINKEIQSFVRLITAIALFIGVVFFIIAMVMGYSWIDAVICSDKTRTLTQNQMTVANMWLNMEVITLETGKMKYAENFDPRTTGWEELGRIACLCSNSVFVDKEENWQKAVNDRDVDGDATEAGMYSSAMSVSWETLIQGGPLMPR